MADELGYYPLPVILSFEGIDKQVNGTLGKAFGDVGKKAAKQIGDGLKSTEADVKSAIDAYSKLRDKAEDSLGNIRKAEAALQDLRDKGVTSGTRFVTAEENLAKARRNSTRAVDEAKKSYSDYEQVQSRLGDGVGKTGSMFDGFGSKAASAGKAVGALSLIAASAAVVGIGALAAGIAVAGSKLYELGSQFDDLSDNLRIKTGATGDSLESLKKSVENLGTTNVPETLGEIGDVAAEVTRSLHLTGPQLEAVTSRLANLGRMGQQVDVRGLGKAFRSFGVDADHQAAALNSLYEASTKSGLSVNDLVASVTKGGPALKALGFNFGQSAALVTTFEDAGIDADKAIAGLTKSAAAFAKDGKAAPEALRDTIGEIQRLIEAGDEAGAQNLSNKVFGAKGGVGFFDAIKSGNLDLQSLSDSLQSTGVDINDVSSETADWSEKWQILKNQLAVKLEPLATGFFDLVNGKLTELSDWVAGHQDQVIDFFADLATGALTAVDAILAFTAQGLRALGKYFDTLQPQLASLGGQLETLGGVLKYIPGFQEMGTAIEAIGSAGSGFAESINGWSGPLNNAATYVDNLRTGIPGLKDDVHNFAEQAKTAADNTISIGNSLAQLAGIKDPEINIKVNALAGSGVIAGAAGLTVPVATVPGQPGAPTSQNPFAGPYQPPRATGGLFGKMPTSAMIQPATAGLVQWAEPSTKGEAFIPLGGGDRSKAIWAETGRQLFSFDQGGFYGAGPDVAAAMSMVGTKYSQPGRTDCSGMVARVIDRAMGLPETDLMSTKTAKQWLAARGFQPGSGGPGMISVGWYDHGPGSNDGHMAMTLSDGTNAESGGKNGVFTVGAGAAGADDPKFDQHMFLPNLFGEGPGGTGTSAGSYGGGGGTAGVGPNGEAGTYSAPDAKSLREANQKVADADTRVKEAEAKQKELEADAKDSQKIAAQADVDKAKREAQDARADLADVQKGKFTAGSGSGKSGGQGGLGQFGGLGDIAGSFLKETLGTDGSFLPDLSSLMPVQMAGTLLSSFKGPLQGLVDGKLGIQQPGWQPGMPVGGVANDTGIGDGVMAPPMPPDGGGGGGGGLPGAPTIIQQNDLSTHYGGDVGMNPETLYKQNKRAQDRGINRLTSPGVLR